MGRIAVTDGMSQEAVKILENAGHEVVLRHHDAREISSGSLSEFDAVVVRSATKLPSDQIAASVTDEGGIRFIGRAGVGVDNIDVDAASKLGIVVCNTPGASTRSVVELTLGHLLASARHIVTADRTLRQGLWSKKELRGTELGGKRLGLLGLGRIARGVAEVASSFGMDIHAYDPYQSDPPDGVTMHDTVEGLFRKCSHISVHCNLTDETRGLVNSDMISLMPGIGADGTDCGNHIVSCARGGIVDEQAASDALSSGMLRSLALDVFETEPLVESTLLSHDGFHGSPHIAASTIEAQSRIGTEMASLLIEFFESGRPSTSINKHSVP
tara:strand:- start:8323 stop:9306 length:984 start_codon:yes stop_codon:yes gene_type:complete